MKNSNLIRLHEIRLLEKIENILKDTDVSSDEKETIKIICVQAFKEGFKLGLELSSKYQNSSFRTISR